MRDRFDGRVALVTGAGSGIGEAIARRFSREGAHVVMIDRDEDGLRRVARDLPPDRTAWQVRDVGDEADARSAVDEVLSATGRIDVLVNNAGTHRPGSVLETSLDDWRAIMAVNVDGVFLLSRAALPALRESRGCVVNTSSVSGIAGDWGQAAYDASKGAVSNLTRAMALDHGRQGVRVNAVAPGLVHTGLTDGAFADGAPPEHLARTALGRLGTADDIAAVVAFLASEDAGFVTGVVIPVDGGVSASNGQPAPADG